jgi:hypothetical protein
MTESQYRILLVLYHQYNDAFKTLSSDIQDAFFHRLYAKD